MKLVPGSSHVRRVGLMYERATRKNTPVEQLRVKHRMEVVLGLRDHPALSRVELCQLLGYSSTTITKVIAELREGTWVTECDMPASNARSGEVGRPRTALQLNPDCCRVMAVVVEPLALHWAMIGLDLAPAEIHSLACPVVDQGPDATIEVLVQLIHAQKFGPQRQAALHAVAIVLPGLTDTQLRVSLHSQQLGWSHVNLAAAIEDQTGLPAIVHNNTRAMGFAEFRHLGLHENEPMLFVQARYGLGAALLNSASPSRRGHYGVSELGHIPLGHNRFADLCRTDGTLVSVTNEHYLRQVLDFQDVGTPVVDELERRHLAGDPKAGLLREQTLENLAIGLGIAVNLLNPRVIVLGGIYARVSGSFIENLTHRVASRVQPILVQSLQIQCSHLGQRGALQGAAIVAFDRLLRQASTYLPHGALA